MELSVFIARVEKTVLLCIRDYFIEKGDIMRTVVMVICFCFCMMGVQAKDMATLRATSTAFAEIAKNCSPAVVFIKVEKKGASSAQMQIPPQFRRFFGIPDTPQEAPPQVGQGTGFIISADGYILTNNHVVGGADKILVTLTDKRECEATIVGADSHSDIAVIKVEKGDLPFLPLGDSDTLQVGEWVIAAGNPFGLSHTITAGIVSAKGRNAVGLADYENFIQTDAAINPGNSGGPLINLDGEVVGINTAIYSRSGGSMGIGFAIPINMAKRIKDQLIENGSVSRGYLGVLIQNITDDISAGFGLTLTQGVLLSQVEEGSPAADAGLKRGDIVIELNGKPVVEVASFRNTVALLAPGTEVALTIIRDRERMTITVTLGTLPGDHTIASKKKEGGHFGFEVRQSDQGVVISQVKSNSVAARAGLRPGMIILEAQRQRIESVKDLVALMKVHKKGEPLMLLIQEKGMTRYIVLR
jgi:serine protease Do